MPTAIVLGASPDPSRFSHRAVQAFTRSGFRTVPVHPQATSVAGIPCLNRLEDAPSEADVLSLYLAPARWAPLVETIASLRPKEAWINPGTEDDRLEARLRAAGIEVRRLCSLVELQSRDHPITGAHESGRPENG